MNTENQRNNIKDITDNDEYAGRKLFFKGFVLTNDTRVDCTKYPFYGKWQRQDLQNNIYILSHPDLNITITESTDEKTVGLIGHAYNPISGIYCEEEILKTLLSIETEGAFYDYVNELTGVFCLFVLDGHICKLINDPVGLQTVFYTTDREKFYVSSHSNLIGDLLGLEFSPYVSKLVKAPTFHYFGNQLPGNITQFSNVFRLNPNHVLICDETPIQNRFYHPKCLHISEDTIRDSLIEILADTMTLIAKKWARPAISLTGGCDSKTTLACAKNVWDKYVFFSYDSQENEKPDMEAADTICKALNLNLIKYHVPYSDNCFENIEHIRAVLLWNGGNIRYNNANDVRKRAFLDNVNDFDVEVKSWASEVGRSRYTKHYNGRTNFGKTPNPRICTTFYKFLPLNRILVNKTDKVFKKYLESYFEPDPNYPIPWQDQFYWEWHWPSRDGITLTCEHLFSNDITVPYNNRKILELLLSMPEEDRVSDKVYYEIRRRLDPRIDNACANITDVNHTALRAKLENLYYIFNRLLPY